MQEFLKEERMLMAAAKRNSKFNRRKKQASKQTQAHKRNQKQNRTLKVVEREARQAQLREVRHHHHTLAHSRVSADFRCHPTEKKNGKYIQILKDFLDEGMRTLRLD